jgi:hypothetical protein
MVALFIVLASLLAAGLLGGGLYWGISAYMRGAKALAEKMPDATVVELALENGGEITLPMLIQHGLSASEAQQRLWQLQTNGVVQTSYDWGSFQSKYVLQGKVRKAYQQLGTDQAKGQLAGKPKKLTDAEVIQLAIRSGGKLTAAGLCVKAQVPVDEAKAKLDELYRKEIFVMDVNEAGTITYLLADQDLLT